MSLSCLNPLSGFPLLSEYSSQSFLWVTWPLRICPCYFFNLTLSLSSSHFNYTGCLFVSGSSKALSYLSIFVLADSSTWSALFSALHVTGLFSDHLNRRTSVMSSFLRSLAKAATLLPYHTLMHHSVHFFHIKTTCDCSYVCLFSYFLIIYLEYKFLWRPIFLFILWEYRAPWLYGPMNCKEQTPTRGNSTGEKWQFQLSPSL